MFPTTMKAVRIQNYGGPANLKLEMVPCPGPGNGEVLVRIHAAGVNPVDWKIREGYLKDAIHHTLPLIPGWDFSGVVEATGPGANRFRTGTEVFGRPDLARDGTYAEYIVVRETEIANKPKNVDHIHAASIPLAGLTAWQALFDTAGLSGGEKVLIHAAAGGVGCMAVQLAKWKGATVIGTCSTRNLGFVREMGCAEAIDYKTTRFEDVVHDVDVVFDTMGGDTQRRSWNTLRKGGVLVSIVNPPNPQEADAHSVRQTFAMVQPNAAQLTELARLVDTDKLRAIVDTVLPLAEARRAQELSQAGHTRGKIILRII